MLLRSSQTAPSPSPSHAVQQHMAELLDLLRHFRPEEEEVLFEFFI
jgi:hypothetical protein